MNTLTLSIKAKCREAYIYAGYLFAVMASGEVRSINLFSLLIRAADDAGIHPDYLKFFFLHNDVLNNSKELFLLRFKETQDAVKKMWRSAEKLGIIETDMDRGWRTETLGEVSGMPLDIKIYGGKIFFGQDNGLYKQDLNFDDKYYIHPGKVEKIFDGESLDISAKNGALAVSTGRHGIFGTLDIFAKKPKVSDRPFSDIPSYRNAWIHNELMSYSSPSEGRMLVNRTVENRNYQRPRRFSHIENSQPRLVFECVGETQLSGSDILGKTKIDTDDILYWTNTSTTSVMLLNGGELEIRNLRMGEENTPYISSKVLYGSKKRIQEAPISCQPFPKGCVMEFFDKVTVNFQNEQVQIGDEETYCVRTFCNSRRYQNLIVQVTEDRILLTTVDTIGLLESKIPEPVAKPLMPNEIQVDEMKIREHAVLLDKNLPF